VRVPKRVHHRRADAAVAPDGTVALAGADRSRATLCMSSAIFYLGNFVTTGTPSFDAMTAFGPLLTTVAAIGRPSEVAMS
jgi:hypothetical protein